MNQHKARRGGGKISALIAVVLIAALALVANQYLGKSDEADAAPASPAQSAPMVTFWKVARADLAIPREYLGRIESIQTVDIRPQITGEITSVAFTEGSFVKTGDTLFTIDDSQYRATVSLRRAEVAIATANHDHAVRYLQRLNASDRRSVSANDLDSANSSVAQTKALLDQANAALRLAEIDLGRCVVKAPIDGRIGRAEFTKGNIVSPSSSPLASIVQTTPIRVAYSVPDRDYLANIDAFTGSGEDVFKTNIVLPGEQSYPLDGKRDFEDNTMDASTGTIIVRERFENIGGKLVPGTMVRVEARPAKPHVAIIVPQQSIISTIDTDMVYVIDSNEKIEARPVKVGSEVGTVAEITEGLKEGERVVYRGIQNVRPGVVVSASEEQQESGPASEAKVSGSDVTVISSEGK